MLSLLKKLSHLWNYWYSPKASANSAEQQVESRNLGLHTINLGTETKTRINPFNGKEILVRVDLGASAAEIEAAHALFNEFKASEPDPEGFRTILLAGCRINLNYHPVSSAVEITGNLNSEAILFLYRFALDSGMFLYSDCYQETIAILPGQFQPLMRERWPNIQPINSPDELKDWVTRDVKSLMVTVNANFLTPSKAPDISP